MAASVAITLDTTPPQVAFGSPERVGPSRLIAVPYVLDEPEVVEGQVNAEPATVELVRLVGASPLDQGGTVHVLALVRDDVWNEALISAALFIAPFFGAYAPWRHAGGGRLYSDRIEVD